MGTKGPIERIGVRADDLHYREHVARYELARVFVTSGPLLDIASGTGYGTELLKAACDAPAVGVDIHHPTVVAARRAYPDPQIVFLTANGTALPFPSAIFSLVVSIETLEHIPDDRVFLGEVARVLRPTGVCVLSATNREYSKTHGIAYPYHVREHSEAELLDKLSDFFRPVHVYYQGFVDSYHTRVRRYAESIQTHKGHLPRPVRWAIDHLYRPGKKLVPAFLTNFFIRRLLGVGYPQPDADDIVLSTESIQDCSTYVVVCHKPCSPNAEAQPALAGDRRSRSAGA